MTEALKESADDEGTYIASLTTPDAAVISLRAVSHPTITIAIAIAIKSESGAAYMVTVRFADGADGVGFSVLCWRDGSWSEKDFSRLPLIISVAVASVLQNLFDDEVDFVPLGVVAVKTMEELPWAANMIDQKVIIKDDSWGSDILRDECEEDCPVHGKPAIVAPN